MNNVLMHYGVKGMKWGVRRYQNYDGTRIKTGSSDTDRVETAKRFFSGDTDARRKEDALVKKEEAEIGKIKQPKDDEWWGEDGRLTKKGRDYLDKVDKVRGKYEEQYRKLWDEHDAELEEQSKKIFLNDDVKPHIENAREIGNKIDALYDEHLGYNSENYKNAFSEYSEKHSGEDKDDIEYGFDHYEWREGHKAFDQASKSYDKEVSKLDKQYKDEITTIGKKVLQDQFDKYADNFTMYEIDNFVRYRYDEVVNHSELGAIKMKDILIHYGVKGMKWGVRKQYEGTGGGGGGGWGPNNPMMGNPLAAAAASIPNNPGGKSLFGKKVVKKMGLQERRAEELARKNKSSKEQDDLSNAIRKDPTKAREMLDKRVTSEMISDMSEKYSSMQQAIKEASNDYEKQEDYMDAYHEKALEWSLNDLKKNNPDLYELAKEEADEGGFDITDHKLVAYGTDLYPEPYNPPETAKTKAADKAMDTYFSSVSKYTNDLIGKHGNEVIDPSSWKYGGAYGDTVESQVHKYFDEKVK